MADCWNRDNNNWDLGLRGASSWIEFDSWSGLVLKVNTVRLGDGMDRAVFALDSSAIFSSK